MKQRLIYFLFFLMTVSTFAQNATVISPNNKWTVELRNEQTASNGKWFLKINSLKGNTNSEIIPKIDLGLLRSDQDFSKDLKFIKSSKPSLVKEQYNSISGKRSQRSNS